MEKIRILIVDDEERIREMIREYTSLEGSILMKHQMESKH